MRLTRIVSLAFLCLAAGRFAGAEQDSFRWQGRVDPGRVIEIKGINGDVDAQSASGSLVEVIAAKDGRRSDPRLVNIQVLEHADGVTICAVYPSDDPSRPNECTPGKGGRNNVRNNDVKVDFSVRVPLGVRFTAQTVNGEVRVESLASDVEAATVNGSVRISTVGYAQAHTVNGSITASMGSASWTEPLAFETVNGSITLQLPPATETEIKAETVNGDISTDFPVSVRGNLSKKRLDGTIGRGGRTLVLKTVNGSVKLNSQ